MTFLAVECYPRIKSAETMPWAISSLSRDAFETLLSSKSVSLFIMVLFAS